MSKELRQLANEARQAFADKKFKLAEEKCQVRMKFLFNCRIIN